MNLIFKIFSYCKKSINYVKHIVFTFKSVVDKHNSSNRHSMPKSIAPSKNLLDIHLAKRTIGMLSQPDLNALRVETMLAEKFSLFLVLNHFLETDSTVLGLSVVDHMGKLLEFHGIYGVILEVLGVAAR